MATPHIAGAMTLLWCARPELRHNISESRTVLNDAAILSPTSSAGRPALQTMCTGWGRVDVLAAVTPPIIAVSAVLEPAYIRPKLRCSDAAGIACGLDGNKCTGAAAALGDFKFRSAHAACGFAAQCCIY